MAAINQIRQALRGERVLMVTYDAAGSSYSLDNGVAVSKVIARKLIQTEPGTQSDLFLVASEDGLFPGFTQTWREEG